MPQTPFDSIESAHEYLDLLVHEAEEVRTGIERDIADAVATEQTRRVDEVHRATLNLLCTLKFELCTCTVTELPPQPQIWRRVFQESTGCAEFPAATPPRLPRS